MEPLRPLEVAFDGFTADRRPTIAVTTAQSRNTGLRHADEAEWCSPWDDDGRGCLWLLVRDRHGGLG